MDIFSQKFLIIFFVTFFLVFLKVRRKKTVNVSEGRHISVIGKRLTTYLSKETPLICLLEEDKKFGEDFLYKKIPTLPHGEKCKCTLDAIIHQGEDLFKKKDKQEPVYPSDIGELKRSDARYYKYFLICNHADATEEIKQKYEELAALISISAETKAKTQKHLKDNFLDSEVPH